MSLSFPTVDKNRPPAGMATWWAPLAFVAISLVPMVVWGLGLDFNPQRVPPWLLMVALWVWVGAWWKLGRTVDARLEVKFVARALLLVLGFAAAWFTAVLVRDDFRVVDQWTNADGRVSLVATRRHSALAPGGRMTVDAVNHVRLGTLLLDPVATVPYGPADSLGLDRDAEVIPPERIELIAAVDGEIVELVGDGEPLAAVSVVGGVVRELIPPGRGAPP